MDILNDDIIFNKIVPFLGKIGIIKFMLLNKYYMDRFPEIYPKIYNEYKIIKKILKSKHAPLLHDIQFLEHQIIEYIFINYLQNNRNIFKLLDKGYIGKIYTNNIHWSSEYPLNIEILILKLFLNNTIEYNICLCNNSTQCSFCNKNNCTFGNLFKIHDKYFYLCLNRVNECYNLTNLIINKFGKHRINITDRYYLDNCKSVICLKKREPSEYHG